jgi:hypothetical protein
MSLILNVVVLAVVSLAMRKLAPSEHAAGVAQMRR